MKADLERSCDRVYDPYDIFVRQARDVSHQALFFLGMLYPTTNKAVTKAVESYGRFAFKQVRSMMGRASFPSGGENLLTMLVQELVPSDPAGSPKWLDELEATVPADREQALKAAKEWLENLEKAGVLPEKERELKEAKKTRDLLAAGLKWLEVSGHAAGGDDFSFERAASWRALVTEFLRMTGKSGLRQRFEDLWSLARKNLSLLLGVVLVGFILFGVEAIHSLWRHEGAILLVPLSVVILPLVGTVLRRTYLRLRYRRELKRSKEAGKKPPEKPLATVGAWDVGGRPFRSVRAMAVEPGRRIRRWPRSETSTRGFFRRLWEPKTILEAILRGQLFRIGAYLIAFAAAVIYSVNSALGTMGTVFAIFAACYWILVLAHLLDFWDLLDPLAVRSLALAALGILILLKLTGIQMGVFTALFAIWSVSYFVWYLKDRSRPFRALLSVVMLVIAVLGALAWRHDWTSRWRAPSSESADSKLAHDRLTAADWPRGPENLPVVVMAASGGGSRSAVFTALTLSALHRDLPHVAGQLQAISSVSGGSLGNAVYVARALEAKSLEDLTRILRKGSGATPDPADDVSQWSYVQAVNQDFLRPTIRGLMNPFRGRGGGIELAFREDPVGLRDRTLGDVIARWQEVPREKPLHLPVPMFNSSTLDGHDMVITPLAVDLYAQSEFREELEEKKNRYLRSREAHGADSKDASTWVYYRHGIYGLEDVLPSYNPRLASAVRASANFPFGFPLVKIESEVPDWSIFNPREAFPFRWYGRLLGAERLWNEVRLTDGGALSNSGMWSLFNLLLNEKEDLRKRGVLLVIVEASNMPSYPSIWKSDKTLAGAIGDQSPIGQYLHRTMIDRLQREYPMALAVVQIDLVPLESRDVLTTWALSEHKFDNLVASFEDRWPGEKKNLKKAWKSLTCRHSEDEVCPAPPVDVERPPLD